MQSKADITVARVPPALFSAAWATCATMVLKGLHAGDMDLRETMDRLAENSLQLWLVLEGKEVAAAFMTELLARGDRRIVNICGLSGSEPRKWAAGLTAEVEKFASLEEADAVRFAGKEGWQGLLPDYAIIMRQPKDVAIFERAVQ